MAGRIRWEPFRGLMSIRETKDRFFEDAFLRTAGGIGLDRDLMLELVQTDNEGIVKASLPGGAVLFARARPPCERFPAQVEFLPEACDSNGATSHLVGG